MSVSLRVETGQSEGGDRSVSVSLRVERGQCLSV